MKKFYTAFLLVLIGLVAPVVAHAYQLTLRIDNPDAVTVRLDYYDDSWSTHTQSYTSASEVVVDFDDVMKYPSLKVNQASGYKITSFLGDDGNSVYGYSGQYTLSLNSGVNGAVYTISTVNLTEARTATAYVKVVGSATNISATRGDEAIDLVDNSEVAVKFIPGTENLFSFTNRNYTPFYRIEVDGETQTMTASSIDVDVVDGTHIEIEADYPEVPVDLTIKVPEGMDGIVKSVRANYTDIQGWQVNKPFEVTAGSSISIELDGDAYKLDSVLINDELQSLSTYIYFTIGTEATVVDIKAHNYAQLNYTVKLDDPTRVEVYEGYSSTPLTGLVAGENHLTISEQLEGIQIKAVTGYDISSVTDKEGNAVTGYSNFYLVSEGSYFDVTSQVRVYDGKFLVYLSDLSNVQLNYSGTNTSAYWQSAEDRSTYNYLEENYNVVPFATAAGEQFMVSVNCKNSAIMYINGELQNNYYGSTYASWYGVPNNGDVIKIYTGGVAPEEHTITFSQVAESAVVTVDKVNKLTEWADGVKALTGTLFEVSSESDKLEVKVDGTAIEKDEDGIYSFAATANHTVSITDSASGVENIKVDTDAANGPVYNLQGIKVLNSAADLKELPAGIYIVNGKKVVR